MESNLVELNIEDVFSNNTYTIPVYQRNYAWKEAQVAQLIQDIYDYAINENTSTQNYYIGSLVVFERKTSDGVIYETIDGQQRLTTLNILFSVLKNEFDVHINNYRSNLHFDSRPMSSFTLDHLYHKNKDEDVNTSEKDLNTRITDAYTVTKNQLSKLQAKGHLDSFVNYLKSNVIILRVPVPHDTNLNHYFEIMNNRGEQLEKHEVLKAKMLKVFSDDKKASRIFNAIWEACANMEKYVQYGFNTSDREIIFGKNWNHFKLADFNDVIDNLQTHNHIDEEEVTIENLLDKKQSFEKQNLDTDDSPERFNSVINFSNFLLHILRILVNQSDDYAKTIDEKNIPLDDKRLLDTFDLFLRQEAEKKKAFVEDFAFLLLKGKHFYDKYIIKRNLKDEKWSLKYLKVEYYDKKASHQYINSLDNSGTNKPILMLLSMFHVSAPTLIYKHWLNAALDYVLKEGKVDGEEYISFLEDLSDAYLFDRFLAREEKDYYNIIYKNDAYASNKIDSIDLYKLNQGTQVENFIFNRLDYLLWKQDQENGEKQFSDFHFSFRTSVEHYYPQNPNEGMDRLDLETLDNFGNLCLISRSKNSKLSNYMPTAKKEHYAKRDSIESIKQQLMMQEESWDKDQILAHSEKMKNILLTTRI